MVMFELYDLNGWHVKISWRNDTTRSPHVLTIPGCQQLCPLEHFKQLTDSVRPADWTQECQLGDTRLQTVVLVATGISISIAVSLLIYTGAGILRSKVCRDRSGYDRV